MDNSPELQWFVSKATEYIAAPSNKRAVVEMKKAWSYLDDNDKEQLRSVFIGRDMECERETIKTKAPELSKLLEQSSGGGGLFICYCFW